MPENVQSANHLTLTSVVFEYASVVSLNPGILNLTLTSVVFELCITKGRIIMNRFNFNKCCI